MKNRRHCSSGFRICRTQTRPLAKTRARIRSCEPGVIKPALGEPVLDHVALGTQLKLFDLERAAKLSGSGFICFTGAGARLERALINFLLDLHTREHGYLEMSPPSLVRRDCMIGTTQLPKFESEMYGLEENQTLSRADGGSSGDQFSPRRNFGGVGAAEEVCRLHALLPARSRLGRPRNARDHSRASVRQGGAGENYDAGNLVCGT